MADESAQGIFRKPTEKDHQYFDEDLNRPKRQKTAREKFEEELSKKEIEATRARFKEGNVEYPKPFAKKAARDDFEKHIQTQIQEQLRMYGRVEYPEKLTLPELDWEKYSDLKNFEAMDEGDRFDSWETKRNPGLTVSAKWKMFRFKGYGDTYRVMEDGPSSVRRAQEQLWKNRQRTEKSNSPKG